MRRQSSTKEPTTHYNILDAFCSPPLLRGLVTLKTPAISTNVRWAAKRSFFFFFTPAFSMTPVVRSVFVLFDIPVARLTAVHCFITYFARRTLCTAVFSLWSLSLVCYFLVFPVSSAGVVDKIAAGLQGNRCSDSRLG